MAFLGIGKKKKVAPDELPDLISDEIEKESSVELGNFLKEEEGKKLEAVSQKPDVKKAEPEVSSEQTREVINQRREVIDRLIKGTEKERKIESSFNHDKSFFNDLQENLTREIKDLDNLEEFYNHKFSNRSVIDDMKSYWDKQKSVSDLESIGNDLQEKISSKTSKLQGFEHEWQKIYFELIEKEEEIKDEEKELKRLLKEFVEICKHKKNSLEAENRMKTQLPHNEKKNKKKHKEKRNKE